MSTKGVAPATWLLLPDGDHAGGMGTAGLRLGVTLRVSSRQAWRLLPGLHGANCSVLAGPKGLQLV